MIVNQHFTTKDRQMVRDLAKRVSEIATDPVMDERRQFWTEHNSLHDQTSNDADFSGGSMGRTDS